MEDQITAEQIAQHYSAAMDSVNFINEINAGEHDETNDRRRKGRRTLTQQSASLEDHACQRLLDDRGLATLP
jgi:hypothetical protein